MHKWRKQLFNFISENGHKNFQQVASQMASARFIQPQFQMHQHTYTNVVRSNNRQIKTKLCYTEQHQQTELFGCYAVFCRNPKISANKLRRYLLFNAKVELSYAHQTNHPLCTVLYNACIPSVKIYKLCEAHFKIIHLLIWKWVCNILCPSILFAVNWMIHSSPAQCLEVNQFQLNHRKYSSHQIIFNVCEIFL